MSAMTVYPELHPVDQVSSVICASLSSFSSLFVMTFILLSQGKLRSAYHRIMFFMSFWDFVSSFAIALTTLPMPVDVGAVYKFPGISIGSMSWCEAQAFVIVLGSAFTICSNLTLNVYYICAIRFGMTERMIQKVVLPICFVLAVATALPTAIVLLREDLLNPVPVYPYCMVGPYPFECTFVDDIDCIRGGGGDSESVNVAFIKAFSGFFIFVLITILISMILVIATVFKTEMEARNDIRNEQEQEQDETSSGEHEEEEEDDDSVTATHRRKRQSKVKAHFKHTRASLRQALMYIAAFILTWAWPVILANVMQGNLVTTIQFLKFIFQPLQGFFNALIFVYSKVCILRQSRKRLSFWKALKHVIGSPGKVPEMLISRMDIVHGPDYESDTDRDGDEPPARQLIRTGAIFHRTDDEPRRAPPSPQSGVSDLESADCRLSAEMSSFPNRTMKDVNSTTRTNLPPPDAAGDALKVITNTGKRRGRGPHPNEERDASEARLPRRSYQWPPPGWGTSSILSGSNDNDNKENTSCSKITDDNNSRQSGNFSTGGMLSWASSSAKSATSSPPPPGWGSIFSGSNNNGYGNKENTSLSRIMDDGTSRRSANFSTEGVLSWASSSAKSATSSPPPSGWGSILSGSNNENDKENKSACSRIMDDGSRRSGIFSTGDMLSWASSSAKDSPVAARE